MTCGDEHRSGDVTHTCTRDPHRRGMHRDGDSGVRWGLVKRRRYRVMQQLAGGYLKTLETEIEAHDARDAMRLVRLRVTDGPLVAVPVTYWTVTP